MEKKIVFFYSKKQKLRLSMNIWVDSTVRSSKNAAKSKFLRISVKTRKRVLLKDVKLRSDYLFLVRDTDHFLILG